MNSFIEDQKSLDNDSNNLKQVDSVKKNSLNVELENKTMELELLKEKFNILKKEFENQITIKNEELVNIQNQMELMKKKIMMKKSND